MVEKREIEQELADALEKSRPPTIPATTRRERDEEGASNHRWHNVHGFLILLFVMTITNKSDQGGYESDSEEARDKKPRKHEEVKRRDDEVILTKWTQSC